MKKGAIIIETWKLPIFKGKLEAADFAFEVHPGVEETLVLKLECPLEQMAELTEAIVEAQRAAQRSRLN
jgi:hypothetical protein